MARRRYAGAARISRTVRGVALLLLLGGLALVLWQRGAFTLPVAVIDPTSRAAFERWLDEDVDRRTNFDEFEGFLSERGVAEVVPAWQLMRVDRFYAGKCDLPVWHLPPRELWPNIVPALELVRDEVEPVLGEVVVLSSYRTPELNACARGASRSRHLSFAALDLRLASPRPDTASLYRDLCAMHESAGPASRMGLGAYYDPGDDGYSSGGRFHVDAAGYRTWGRGYSSASSPCGKLG